MTEIFYEKKDSNYLDNLKINVKNLYDKYPINIKKNPKPD